MNEPKGLSQLQKQIMNFVREKGYVTTFDAVNFALNMDVPDFCKGTASAYASTSRSLRRLTERGLLRKVPSRYVGYAPVFVSPDFTDEPPLIERRTIEVEAYRFLETVKFGFNRLNKELKNEFNRLKK